MLLPDLKQLSQSPHFLSSQGPRPWTSWPACLIVLPAFNLLLQTVVSPLPVKLFSTLLLLGQLLLVLQGFKAQLRCPFFGKSSPPANLLGLFSFLWLLTYARHYISIILFTHEISVPGRLNSVGHNNEAFPPHLSLSPVVLNLPFPSLNDISSRLHYFWITFCC